MGLMRIAIVGPRDYDDYRFFSLVVGRELGKFKDVLGVEIVTGDADGADAMARRYAKDKKITCEVKEADWDKYGKAAGPIRNKEIVEDSWGPCIAFWNGTSRGTLNTITQMMKAGRYVSLYSTVRDEDE